ncbi:MAG: type III pantothenate kinase [Candidatus Aadella gelida]|nr:type III pantothenate kinase [Candidatus Aadella gelida]
MTKLLIDIGNTNTSLAVTDGRKLLKRWFINTSKKRLESASLKRLLGTWQGKITEIVIVSVVPAFLGMVKKNLKIVIPKSVIKVVGKDLKVPIKIKYDEPAQVGQDRLVTAFGVYMLKRDAAIVIDFGTAVTFDLVNKRGQYEGGLIFPGLRLGLAALTENAALLPRAELKPAKGLIGRNTRDSMNKGVLFGYASMCDGMICRIRGKYGKNIKIVATGGDATLIARYSQLIHKKNIYPDLIFKGLNLISLHSA